MVGMLDPTPKGMSLIDFFLSQSTLRTIGIGSREDLENMSRALSFHGVHPIIDRVFPFEEAKAAYQYYEEAQPFGKVIISQG